MLIGQGAINRLTDKSPEKLELLSEFLDLARFSEPDHESRTAATWREKYAGRRPDVVITAGGEASQFLLKHRDAIAPNVPIVVCCLPAETFAALGGSDEDNGRYQRAGYFKDAGPCRATSARCPQSCRHRRRDRIRSAMGANRPPADRESRRADDTRYLVGLPHDALIKEVSRLPRDTIAIALTYFADDRGGRYVSPDVIKGVAKAASAPVYSPYPTGLGFGIVGGYSDFDEFDGGPGRRPGLGNSGRQGPKHDCSATEHSGCIQGRRATAQAVATL